MGFTIIEMAVAAVISIIVILGLGVFLAHGAHNWNLLYNKAFTGINQSGYVAVNAFNSLIRKSTASNFVMEDATPPHWIEVYYYLNDASTTPDRYALLYRSGSDFIVEYGTISPRQSLSTQTICSHVTNCVFNNSNGAIQMILTLVDGSNTATVISSATMHN